MSTPVRFLHSLAHATATLGLYSPGHPARRAALDAAWKSLGELRPGLPAPRFSFLDGAVIAGEQPLHELRAWSWGRRLARAGIQRIEIDAEAGQHEFDRFVTHAASRLGAELETGIAAAGDGTIGWIRWGALAVRDGSAPSAGDGWSGAYPIDEEVELVRWIYHRAEESDDLPMDEVETVVASLAVAVHGEGRLLEPLLEQGGDDRYGAVHAINVATLAMSLADRLGIGSRDVRAIGTAALLCDIGMTRVPRDVLALPALTDGARRAIRRHTVEGARLLLARRGDFELPAIVAYEHHLQPDGRGYPVLPRPREPHYVSRLVRVCDVYDALRSVRASRPAWGAEEALGHLERGAGTSFDAGIARVFVEMMSEAERGA